MAASSVTGTGIGSSNKPTVKDLAIAANGPTIHFSGIITSAGMTLSPPSSPPSTLSRLTFPYPLTGGASDYVVMLTTLNGGYAYVSDLDENDDGDFTGFSFVTEAECDLMYLVVSCGIKPLTM